MKKLNIFTSVLLLSIIFTGCKDTKQNLQKRFKYNTNYFLGLQNLDNKKLSEAETNFSICAKKGSGYCARYSEIELIKLQNQRNRIEKWQTFLQKYSDDQALLVACTDFYNCSEFSKVIFYTNEIDLKKADNSLISIRLKSMKEKNDSRYESELFCWFTERNISAEHFNFYKSNIYDFIEQKNILNSDKNTENQEQNNLTEKTLSAFPVQDSYLQIIGFRMLIYKKLYLQAYEQVKNLLSIRENQSLPLLLYSDLGKALYYGDKNYLANAKFLDSLIYKTTNPDELFYLNFYAGKLYYTEGEYITRAENRYKSAMENAKDNDKYDNALWYLLQLKLKRNTEEGVKSLIQYCSLWHNPNYFNDLLDLISNLLLTEGKWNSFYKVYKAIDGYASDYMVSRFAYIYGRLLQENLATLPEESLKEKEVLIEEAFSRSLNCGSDYYYQLLSINQLKLSPEEIENQLCKVIYSEKEKEIDREAEILLSGYASFGFPEKIYPEFIKLTEKGSKLSSDSMLSLSAFLQECGEKKNQFYPQSLRLAVAAVKNADRKISKDELKRLFPKDYSSIVGRYCFSYEIPEEILYALIRSESFFDNKITSSASAVGLTQLMTPTAMDIAKKLKKSDYDLLDPETNIGFGSFYLSDLARRLNGKWLPALLSYNTGITRIRRWLSVQNNLPMDLFLEVAPYEETREYGRKLLSASCMYSWIYDNKNINETIKLLFN